MTKENSYVIDGKRLQVRIQQEMQDAFACFLKWNGDENREIYYELFRCRLSSLGTLLEIQGNSVNERSTIINYFKDFCVKKCKLYNKC